MSRSQILIDVLKTGQDVSYRPHGNSMGRIIRSGALVVVRPFADDDAPRVGDVVLAKVKGRVYLHLVTALDGNRVQIGNAVPSHQRMDDARTRVWSLRQRGWQIASTKVLTSDTQYPK